VTTENSDWATNCPEYKVTAVEVVLVNQGDAWKQRAAEERESPLSPRKRARDPAHA
jgi:formate dehydrogenase major subunit